MHSRVNITFAINFGFIVRLHESNDFLLNISSIKLRIDYFFKMISFVNFTIFVQLFKTYCTLTSVILMAFIIRFYVS